MIKKCLECKYFEKGHYVGTCELHTTRKRNDDTCEDFTCKCGEPTNDTKYEDRLNELELRVLKLESIRFMY